MTIKIGDVFEIKTSQGYVYIQYTHNHANYGTFIRVIEGIYKERQNNLITVVNNPTQFCAYTVLPNKASHSHKIIKIGSAEIPEFAIIFPPIFKTREFDAATGRSYWILSEGIKKHRVDNLSEIEKKYPIEELISEDILIHQIENQWTPVKESERILESSIRTVCSDNITKALSVPIQNCCKQIQFSTNLSNSEYSNLAKFMSSNPNVLLRVYGTNIQNLDFLQYFSFLKFLTCDIHTLNNCNGLTHLKNLVQLNFYVTFLSNFNGFFNLPINIQELTLDVYKDKFSLSFLEFFVNLKYLSIKGLNKGLVKAIPHLQQLKFIKINSVNLVDLICLKNIKSLEKLHLKSTKTILFDSLVENVNLKEISLVSMKNLNNISFVSEMQNLEFINLEKVENLRNLNPLKKLSHLKKLRLKKMKQLNASDLKVLLELPNLEELVFEEMEHIEISSLEFLKKLTSLRKVAFGKFDYGLIPYWNSTELNELLNLPCFDDNELRLMDSF